MGCLSLPNPKAVCIPSLLQHWLHVQACAAVDARGDSVVVPPGPVLGVEMLFLWRLSYSGRMKLLKLPRDMNHCGMTHSAVLTPLPLRRGNTT